MQISKIGLVLFNNKFEDGSLPTPPLPISSSTPSISSLSPLHPLPPPLSKIGKVPFFSLLHGRGEKMRLHLNSFIKEKKIKIKTENSKERKKNKSLQQKILECKNPEEIESLLILEGVLKVDS